MDYSEYGGAPLLGLRGIGIVCHGRSNANAIKNAIRVAYEFCDQKVNEAIEREFLKLGFSRAEDSGAESVSEDTPEASSGVPTS